MSTRESALFRLTLGYPPLQARPRRDGLRLREVEPRVNTALCLLRSQHGSHQEGTGAPPLHGPLNVPTSSSRPATGLSWPMALRVLPPTRLSFRPQAAAQASASSQGRFYRRKKELREDQLNEIQDSFDLFDKDGTGTIDAEDLWVVMRALGCEPRKVKVQHAHPGQPRLVGWETARMYVSFDACPVFAYMLGRRT